ncbi:MAG: FAD-binding protein [Alphaproteobacteria bacterium]|nr:FAD-binding protein [Alphaproteobacteria bacterium]
MATLEQVVSHIPNHQAPRVTRVEIDRRRDAARAIAADLARRLRGELRFDDGSRALYAHDLSIHRQVPIGVVIPRDEEDVIATVEACRRHNAPILGRGCGTSLSGQTCNVAVVIDFSKYMNRLLWLDPAMRLAHVQPGLINDQLRDAARQHGLTFAPDPATHKYCTLGGNIGNNSCGAHTVMGGKTVDNVMALDVLTYDGLRMTVGATSDEEIERIVQQGGRRGDIYRRLRELGVRYEAEIRKRYPDIPRRVSGYNLDELIPGRGFNVARSLVGSESTCALTLAATLRLIPYPAHRALLLLSYGSAPEAADDVPAIREQGPTALEGFHRHLIQNMTRKGKAIPGVEQLPEGDMWLLVEFGGDSQEEANGKAEAIYEKLKRGRTGALGMRVIEKEADQQAIWHIRESGVGASRIPEEEEAWPSWEDSAVPPERLGDYLRAFDKLAKRYGYKYSMFGHYGDGCIHSRITFGLRSQEGVEKFRAYMEEAADLCLSYGGSLSGEHGDGQAKGELLPRMFGADLIQAFREFKSIWDPQWRMNPGKLIDAYPLDSNIRVGPDYNPHHVETHFKFPDDKGVFAHAAERCFGVGKCRTPGGQTMCPSFQATREEMHSTRGRAHLLFEMMRGDVIKDGWRSEAVAEALDLCLQCKGCKHDCPVSVDMATYKAEFLSHHYKGRLRPRSAYSMGLIFWWSPLAMMAPGVVNTVLRAPGLGPALRRMAGFATERDVPTFAPETFQSWFRRRERTEQPNPGGKPVILWPDTFNNHFLPGTAKAAVEVLEAAGYRVIVPRQRLCCGRPLYDYGMLDLAKRKLHQTIDALRPAIRAGIPVVGLEPSCVSVFRDEMPNLLTDNEDAQRLALQTKTLSELLMATPGWTPPPLERKALVHVHCHHKSVLDDEAEHDMLHKMGLDYKPMSDGCCGQAGSFGYEANHYEVSMRVGEDALLPAVRNAASDTLLIADGFSCREQIRHGADRWAMHPAEVLALAQRSAALPPDPERRYLEPAAKPDPARLAIAAGVLAAVWLGARAARRW